VAGPCAATRPTTFSRICDWNLWRFVSSAMWRIESEMFGGFPNFQVLSTETQPEHMRGETFSLLWRFVSSAMWRVESRELNFVLGFPKFPSPLRTETQPDTHAQNHSRPLGAHDRSDSRFYVSSIGFAGGPGLVYGLSVPTVLSAVLHPSAIAALNAMGYSGTGLI